MEQTSTGRRGGGRAARQAARTARAIESVPFLARKLTPFEVLDDEGLSSSSPTPTCSWRRLASRSATFPKRSTYSVTEVVRSLRPVRFPAGLARSLLATAPSKFTQHARNPDHDVVIGDPHVVFAPAYGSPFVRDLEEGRRYATLADFENFARLTHMTRRSITAVGPCASRSTCR